MKKNKLITLILALAVCSSLILSLCSFTTIKGVENYNVMTPYYDVGVGYTYHRVTATLDELYYGYIPSFNQLLADNSFQRWSTNRASDYLIVGTSSLDYSLDVAAGALNQFVALTSDTPDVAYFNGLVKLSGEFTIGETNSVLYSDFISFINPAVDTGSPNYFDFVVSGYYFRSDNTIEIFRYSVNNVNIFDHGGLLTENSISLNVGRLCDYLYYNAQDNYNPYLVGDLFVDSITITSASNHFTAAAVTSDMLYYQAGNYTYFNSLLDRIEFLRDSYGDIQYESGYESGFNTGSNTWASVGDFFTTTVGSFMEFEFIPNVSIGGVLAIFVGAALLLAFLKVFAGG